MILDPDFVQIVRGCWSRETSADEKWSAENPALGQCAVTALLVQDYYGGDLLRGVVGDVSHYWNRLPGGAEVDLTREQFDPEPTELVGIHRHRSYLFENADTALRYGLLAEAVRAASQTDRQPHPDVMGTSAQQRTDGDENWLRPGASVDAGSLTLAPGLDSDGNHVLTRVAANGGPVTLRIRCDVGCRVCQSLAAAQPTGVDRG